MVTWLRDTLTVLAIFVIIGTLAWLTDRFAHRNDAFNRSERDEGGR